MTTEELETGDPSTPPDLLELHILLEDLGVSPEAFKEAFGNETGS
jgi:hypothetical protein